MEEKLSAVHNTALNDEGSTEPRTAQYWAVFLQPLPETGERIVIALVFRDVRGRAWIEFDSHFSKALTLYPDLDQGTLRFYLESLRRDLDASDVVEAVLNSYGPQLATSSPRRIASPITRQVIVMLLARYVYHSKRSVPLVAGAERYARERYLAPSVESVTASSKHQGRSPACAELQNASTMPNYANA